MGRRPSFRQTGIEQSRRPREWHANAIHGKLETAMTIDERLDRLTERHEALTQTIELLTHDVSELRATVEVDAQNIRALARIAEIH
jgi:archaellum component FlaC